MAIRAKNFIQAKVTGTSMFPLLSDDSLVRIVLCSPGELRRGDVIVVKTENGFICHRFFSRIELGGAVFLKTKGDLAAGFDPLTDARRLVGKVDRLNQAGRLLGLFFSLLSPVTIRIMRNYARTKKTARNV